jgi:hypothetical protein
MDVGSDDTWAIEAVVTRTGTAGGSVWETIAAKWNSPNFGYVNAALACGAGASVGKPQGSFNVASAPSTRRDAAATSALSNGVRTHLMAVRTPGSGGTGSLLLYENGALVATYAAFPSTEVGVASGGSYFCVGGTSDSGYFPASYGFIGKVEHVAVYDTTITAARALYHAQILGLA